VCQPLQFERFRAIRDVLAEKACARIKTCCHFLNNRNKSSHSKKSFGLGLAAHKAGIGGRAGAIAMPHRCFQFDPAMPFLGAGPAD